MGAKKKQEEQKSGQTKKFPIHASTLLKWNVPANDAIKQTQMEKARVSTAGFPTS